MSLTRKHLRDVCMLHGGADGKYHKQCRYLAQDNKNWNKHMCCKLVTKKAAIVDIEIGKFLAQCKKNNQDPNLQSRPLGNNCAGYPFFKFKKQGYDKDGMNLPKKP